MTFAIVVGVVVVFDVVIVIIMVVVAVAAVAIWHELAWHVYDLNSCVFPFVCMHNVCISIRVIFNLYEQTLQNCTSPATAQFLVCCFFNFFLGFERGNAVHFYFPHFLVSLSLLGIPDSGARIARAGDGPVMQSQRPSGLLRLHNRA